MKKKKQQIIISTHYIWHIVKIVTIGIQKFFFFLNTNFFRQTWVEGVFFSSRWQSHKVRSRKISMYMTQSADIFHTHTHTQTYREIEANKCICILRTPIEICESWVRHCIPIFYRPIYLYRPLLNDENFIANCRGEKGFYGCLQLHFHFDFRGKGEGWCWRGEEGFADCGGEYQ